MSFQIESGTKQIDDWDYTPNNDKVHKKAYFLFHLDSPIVKHISADIAVPRTRSRTNDATLKLSILIYIIGGFHRLIPIRHIN